MPASSHRMATFMDFFRKPKLTLPPSLCFATSSATITVEQRIDSLVLREEVNAKIMIAEFRSGHYILLAGTDHCDGSLYSMGLDDWQEHLVFNNEDLSVNVVYPLKELAKFFSISSVNVPKRVSYRLKFQSVIKFLLFRSEQIGKIGLVPSTELGIRRGICVLPRGSCKCKSVNQPPSRCDDDGDLKVTITSNEEDAVDGEVSRQGIRHCVVPFNSLPYAEFYPVDQDDIFTISKQVPHIKLIFPVAVAFAFSNMKGTMDVMKVLTGIVKRGARARNENRKGDENEGENGSSNGNESRNEGKEREDAQMNRETMMVEGLTSTTNPHPHPPRPTPTTIHASAVPAQVLELHARIPGAIVCVCVRIKSRRGGGMRSTKEVGGIGIEGRLTTPPNTEDWQQGWREGRAWMEDEGEVSRDETRNTIREEPSGGRRRRRTLELARSSIEHRDSSTAYGAWSGVGTAGTVVRERGSARVCGKMGAGWPCGWVCQSTRRCGGSESGKGQADMCKGHGYQTRLKQAVQTASQSVGFGHLLLRCRTHYIAAL
ncbi:hypothetical protein BDN71DRAFT_1434571 [Pleurotus eryngii]|uniref:Uncharacterized protein n=1 Tax=Pleurotus eryngii TaxID=5323 RepID=A0A9P5ZP79_PLEER|nr:hypothetical protein BDN71DRAFT_1434571 [Pleurotus eryngii]